MNNVQFFTTFGIVAVASGVTVFGLTREEPAVASSIQMARISEHQPPFRAPSCGDEDLATVRQRIADSIDLAVAAGEPRTPYLEMSAALSVCSVDEIAAIGRAAAEESGPLLRR